MSKRKKIAIWVMGVIGALLVLVLIVMLLLPSEEGDVVELLTNPLYSKPWMGLTEGEAMNPFGVVRVFTCSGLGINRAATRGEDIVLSNQSLQNHVDNLTI